MNMFWNFAAAARTLREQYIDVHNIGCIMRSQAQHSCFLKAPVDMLEWLQKKA
jgi:hypothetical protein